MKPRPVLSDVLGAAKPRAHSAPSNPGRKPGRRASGAVQVNVLLPADLRLEAKAEAMRAGRDFSDVVEELLRTWLDRRGKTSGCRAS